MTSYTARYITSTNLGMFKSTYPSKTASLQSYKKHTLYDIFEELDEGDEENYNDYAANSNQNYFANKRYSTSSSYSISDHLETIYEVEEEQQQE
ncbi:anthranilate synthase / indole-3-glycerol phosphate synthase [Mucor velutinosus]|uniref:Anthranilate synthase / indole-3-glycerol phosphate synthase n=1 Tax=Mucor velutinosus TaxID=708070 RepID=A0AAN7I119_9FUNG|nr:anthranilate synthase / indole-3-glycerol phosphate synthase [Mucor velutinosus]